MCFRKKSFSWDKEKQVVIKRIKSIRKNLEKHSNRLSISQRNNQSLKQKYDEHKRWIDNCVDKAKEIERFFSSTLFPRGRDGAMQIIEEIMNALSRVEQLVPGSVQFQYPYEHDVYPALLQIEIRLKEIFIL